MRYQPQMLSNITLARNQSVKIPLEFHFLSLSRADVENNVINKDTATKIGFS